MIYQVPPNKNRIEYINEGEKKKSVGNCVERRQTCQVSNGELVETREQERE